MIIVLTIIHDNKTKKYIIVDVVNKRETYAPILHIRNKELF
jgi:hypothetical protein